MAIGLGLLRLSPDAFWTMTPVEFERALSALRPAKTAPLCRAGLAALMRAFPDKTAMEKKFG
ncbi:MAG: hypothetical protein ABS35_46795 [Kaistia sp. SCN 65-12]|nr:MAG: hypothetical protein ABS35_46795 [Kaistia sp. SCN 65-12]